MVKDIIKDPEILSKRSIEWDVVNNQQLSTELVQNLDDTIEANNDLTYLCANEIGYKERAIDIRFSDDTYIFMNPMFQKTDELTLVREFDRINGKEYIVPRFNTVELVYQDCLGSTRAAKFTESGAFVVCQAMDTVDGLFASDYGLEIIPEFDEASQEEQQEVIDAWLKTFDERYKQIDNDLSTSSDNKLKEVWNASKFIDAVRTGKVELEKPKHVSKREQKRLNKLVKDATHKINKLKFWRKISKHGKS